MRFLFILGLITLLISCGGEQEPVNTSSSHPIIAENRHLQVELIEYSITTFEEEPVIKTIMEVTTLENEFDLEQDFFYDLTLVPTGVEPLDFELIHEEKEIKNNRTFLTAFYSIDYDADLRNQTLVSQVHIKPNYYTYNIQFPNMSHHENNLTENDFLITELNVHKQVLEFTATDIHPIKGLDVSININNEKIYPTFSTTEYDTSGHAVAGKYEFFQNIPASFDLLISRNQLIEPVWTFSLPFEPNPQQQ
ncbi:hypothetical protein AJ85_08535 [Alkalihalobacillus alcalophilus ATCC 27647 = CGMCC 1.3604]|uniref:Uncharacterized protein n=1 Tax=Alkalihalobacillus alcalophilus ATCC 27647 = CGMCC 1.3604 TaxID=1218173 RepID=A0A094WKI2_ALKAL|nr:hypothetical protein [Alkalihalobacillus alcalophilus]KGA97356.1 hypothetical protein BALCAV_0210615 [Alkalihalobacillus alcalophilus ATCC 27647 = CGMCC 1.3604]MED1562103.1 hypothetical protein [Alkalihalobacillus alcalophilus]THG90840.1 hypothetical protein AJ85_08535 [Alkalihalobacillus alcalophilus ATCC 27647 = CGMCC 1.3604]